MHLTEVDFGAALPVDGYGADFFRLGGVAHAAPILAVAGQVMPWGGYEDAATLTELSGHVDVLLLGTGGQIAHIPTGLRRALEEAGVGVEVMDSPAACRTYNVLLSESRRVALAVLPVG